jgi:predicted ATPase/class 3 adenylate cyclase
LLFTDIEGSTRLLQQVGHRYDGVLTECRQLLRAVFHQWKGYEVDTQGDAFFVAFARATDAVSAAVEMQRALASHPWADDLTIRVRMGLHTGEPQLSAEGYVGLDVHHASRIMSAGHGGQVLLSQTTRDLVDHDLPTGVRLRDLGAHRLKDLLHPSHLFQLVIAGLPADFPPLKTLDTHPNNLPIQPTSFIGREQEVRTVCELLRWPEVRLLTLTGPGGTGKTRLGLQVAEELSDSFAHGVFFVNLAPLSDPALVVPTIANTLELRASTDQALLDLLKAYLRDKQLLLLLDNFEQVASAAVQVADLLAVCPKLKVLVTSRMVLHVQAEQEFAVPPLVVPDPKRLPDLATLSQYEAVALFISRAQAVKPEFLVSNANAPAVAEICVRLDGLPLAIELAAARIKLLPPQALLARLGKRLAVLTSGAHDAPARQRTLRNTISWSYHLLDADEQRLFRRLSVFVGGCTIQAIEAVCSARGNGALSVLDAVASLIDKSLLRQTEQEGVEPRFVMLETIREYGLECLVTSGEMEITHQAHAAYYLWLAEEAEPELVGPLQTVWLERLEREHDNLRAALGWFIERGGPGSSREMPLRLAGALRRFWEVRGHWGEGQNFLERALAGSKGVAVQVQVKALKAAAHLAYNRGPIDRAEALYEECLARCRELGDTGGLALSLRLLGAIAANRSNYVVASSRTEESLALFRAAGDKEGIAWALNNLAEIVSQQGEYDRAISLTEESLALFRAAGNIEGIAWELLQLAGVLFITEGNPAKVHALLEEGLALSRELGYQDGISLALIRLGEEFLQQGDAVKARSLLEESLVLLRELGDWLGTVWSLSRLAGVAALQGDYAEARTLYEESLALEREVGGNENIASCLEGLASVVAAQGDPVWAARLWGTAEARREALGTPLPPVYRADYERAVAAARTQLGEKFFAAAWAAGRASPLEQVIDEVLNKDGAAGKQ